MVLGEILTLRSSSQISLVYDSDCPAGWVSCKDGRECIPAAARCNMAVDCKDESDEMNCTGK